MNNTWKNHISIVTDPFVAFTGWNQSPPLQPVPCQPLGTFPAARIPRKWFSVETPLQRTASACQPQASPQWLPCPPWCHTRQTWLCQCVGNLQVQSARALGLTRMSMPSTHPSHNTGQHTRIPGDKYHEAAHRCHHDPGQHVHHDCLYFIWNISFQQLCLRLFLLANRNN